MLPGDELFLPRATVLPPNSLLPPDGVPWLAWLADKGSSPLRPTVPIHDCEGSAYSDMRVAKQQRQIHVAGERAVSIGTKGQAYVNRGAAYYDIKRQEKERIALQRRASILGFKLVPVA